MTVNTKESAVTLTTRGGDRNQNLDLRSTRRLTQIINIFVFHLCEVFTPVDDNHRQHHFIIFTNLKHYLSCHYEEILQGIISSVSNNDSLQIVMPQCQITPPNTYIPKIEKETKEKYVLFYLYHTIDLFLLQLDILETRTCKNSKSSKPDETGSIYLQQPLKQ